MHYFYKYFFLLLTLCCVASCQEDETLDLKNYPTPAITVSVLNSETPASAQIAATYQSDGKLALDGSLGFKISLKQPYIEDVVIDLDYALENISQENDAFKRQVTIPAGLTECVVSLDDLVETFTSLDEVSYGIVTKVANVVVGNENITTNASAEIKIAKEAFSSEISVEGETGNSVSFTRVCFDGEIKNETGMSTKLFAKLSKAFYEDVKLSLSINATDEKLKDNVSFSTTEVVIPAGSLVSSEVVCQISDDFLLETDQDATYTFDVVAELAAEDAHLNIATGMNFTINKTSNVISLSKVQNPDFVKMDRSGWKISAAPTVEGRLTDIIDDSEYSYVTSYSNTPLWIVVDFEKTEVLKGAGFNISSRIWYPPTKVELFISENGTDWKSIGTSAVPSPQDYDDMDYYLDFLVPISTRYIKYTVLEASSSTKYLAEFYTFK